MNHLYTLYSVNINKIRGFIVGHRDKLKALISTNIRINNDRKYLNTNINQYNNSNLNILYKISSTEKIVDILTIAFNNLETIQTQVTYLKKYLKDNFKYIVVDNSTKEEASTQIEKYCKKMKISYVRLLNNPYNGVDPSRSHGMALDWSYRNIIKNSRSRYFGTIDHDIYPVKNTSIIQFLKKTKVWGHYHERENRWYLWPGFSFFDKNGLENINVDFLPVPGLDTGGANWESIYKYLNRNEIKWPVHRYIRYRPGKIVQSSSVEQIGDWIHLINASGWKDGKVKENIDDFIKKILVKIKKK